MTPDTHSASSERISTALDEIETISPHQTDGKWLEQMTAACAPLIAEWDVSGAWLWQDWPDRQTHYPNTPDIGIDIVAKRASDGRFIAIQSKSRKLDEHVRTPERDERLRKMVADDQPSCKEIAATLEVPASAVRLRYRRPCFPITVSDMRRKYLREAGSWSYTHIQSPTPTVRNGNC